MHTNMSATGTLLFGGDGDAGSEQTRAALVLNGVNSMTLQSQRTNVAAYMPTDCPTREKHGWMGDALDASEQALYNFDTEAMHTAFMQLIEDSQGGGGDVPTVIPSGVPKGDSCHDIAWTSVYPQLANMLHTYHGDTRVVERHHPSLVSYIENLVRHAAKTPNDLAECDQYKDWLCGNAQSCCSNAPSGSTCPVPQEMGAFNYVLALRAMANMSSVLGLHENATRYAGLASAATASFHSTFWNPKLQAYGGDLGATQSLATPALVIDSAPTALRTAVVKTLAHDVAVTSGYQPYVGAVTSKVLLNVLSDHGLHSAALQTASSTKEPSWGYWWSQNSSTCWESWPIGHGTRNHIFLCGGAGEWFWKHLIGLTPSAPAFSEVAVAPKVHPTLGPASAQGDYLSASGGISVSWKVADKGARVALNVSLPVGVQRATVAVPKPFGAGGDPVLKAVVSEGGATVWDGTQLVGAHPGLISATDAADSVVFEAKNGVYVFEAKNGVYVFDVHSD